MKPLRINTQASEKPNSLISCTKSTQQRQIYLPEAMKGLIP